MDEHYISESNTEHVCGMCGAQATHKIEEAIPSDEPGQSEFESQRHEFTNWICCKHFGEVMGPAAVAWCGQEKT